MNIFKLSLIFAIIVLVFSYCTKNPLGTDTDKSRSRILFLRYLEESNEISTIKPDGLDIRVLKQYSKSEGTYYSQGYTITRWSPDKSKIVVQGGPGSTLEYQPLWMMDMEGNLLYRLVWNGYMPVWTSDGENVIYSRRRGYSSLTYDIYRININSLQEDTLIVAEVGEPGSNSGFIYTLLDILPQDNSKLLLNEMYTYTDTSSGRQTTNDPEILIYDYVNHTKTYLTNNNLDEGWGRISPDGNTIVYSIKNTGSIRYSNNLYLMTMKGDSIRQLTFGATDVYLYLSWSPDGKKISFSKSDRSQGYNSDFDIFIIDIQSGNIDRLTDTAQDSISNAVMDWK